MARRSLRPLPKRQVIIPDEIPPRRRVRSQPAPQNGFEDPDAEAAWQGFAQKLAEASEKWQHDGIWSGNTESEVDTRSDEEKLRDIAEAEAEARVEAAFIADMVEDMEKRHPFEFHEWLQDKSLEAEGERLLALRAARREDLSGHVDH
ncbi:hypothetical protein R3P38DRAFT_3195937 [Favolaschia claudopus]|uniref:Uncharacterized protein n=1 Tax=Favolaschia claudopus TaxID=2862362 RepID=A0AAW0B9S9_9AGAR